MNPNVRVQSIIDRYPDSEETFRMYDIDIGNDNVLQMTLDSLSEEFEIELEDLLMDIEELIQESRNTRWISSENDSDDSWTESFTEDDGDSKSYDDSIKGFDGTENFNDGNSNDFDME
jgi:hypothetical protein